jgi:hypothetical protein
MQDNILYDNTDDRFKPLIGKKVQCKDKHGKVRVGILDFAGINEILHGQFQVTLSRTPIWPVNPKTIKEYENNLS